MVLIASKELEALSKKPVKERLLALKHGSSELGRWIDYNELREFRSQLERSVRLETRIVYVYQSVPKRSRRTEDESAVSDWLPLSKICLGE